MRLLTKLTKTLSGRSKRLREIDEELDFHLEQRRAEYAESGLSAEDADRSAKRLVGNMASLRDRVNDAETMRWLADILRDLRLATRSLRRRKALTLTVVMSIGLSVAATTSLFGYVDAVFLKPLSLPHPEEVVAINEFVRGESTGSNPLRMQDWATQVEGFSAVGGYYSDGAVITGEGNPSRVLVLRTFGDLMGVIGAQPAMGRTFNSSEARGEGDAVAILTHRFYSSHYGAKAQVLGRVLRLNGTAYSIIGVMPKQNFPPDTEVITPAPETVQRTPRTAGFLSLVARMRPGMSMAAVQQQLDTVTNRLAADYPATDQARTTRVQSVRDEFSQNLRRPLLLIFSAALLLLLLANVNVATLLMTRSVERAHEASIRMAIGAGRASLTRLYLSESMLLAFAGGLLGALLGRLFFSTLQRMLPADVSLPTEAVFDWRVTSFCFLVSLFSGLLFGLAPAIAASRNGTSGLTVSSPLSASRTQLRWRRGLIVVQVALSTLLLTGVGLTARSLYRVQQESLGFEPAGTVSVSVEYPWDTPLSKLGAVSSSALEALERAPDVISAGLIDRLPLGGGSQSDTVRIEGTQLTPQLETLTVDRRAYEGDYFATMGIPLIEGRLPRKQRPGNSPEILVNQTFVRRFFPSGNAISHRVLSHSDLGKTDNKYFVRIVGVVGDTRVQPTQQAQPPEMFLLASNTYWPYLNYVAKVRTTSQTTFATIRTAIQSADPNQVVSAPKALQQVVDSASGDQRSRLYLLALFAFAAVMLSCIGLWGVLAGEVVRQKKEIGLRLSLGATRHSVLLATLRSGLAMTLSGVVVGILISLLCGRLIEGLLYGVKPNDTLTWMGSSVLLLLVGLAASYVPARSAANVDPATTLRNE